MHVWTKGQSDTHQMIYSISCILRPISIRTYCALPAHTHTMSCLHEYKRQDYKAKYTPQTYKLDTTNLHDLVNKAFWWNCTWCAYQWVRKKLTDKCFTCGWCMHCNNNNNKRWLNGKMRELPLVLQRRICRRSTLNSKKKKQLNYSLVFIDDSSAFCIAHLVSGLKFNSYFFVTSQAIVKQ